MLLCKLKTLLIFVNICFQTVAELACFYAIPSTIKVENGSPDGNGGFGIAYKSTSEDYGMLIVFSYGKAVYMKIKSITWGNWKKVKFIE